MIGRATLHTLKWIKMEELRNFLLNYHVAVAVILFFTCLISAVFAYPRLIRYFEKKKLLDLPNERKIHQQPVPSSGGLLFCLSLIFCIPIFLSDLEGVFLIFGSLAMLLLGFVDDRRDLKATKKFVIQIALAIMAVFCAGPMIVIPDVIGIDLAILNASITVLFIVGYVNAFNLMDGSDGLAGVYSKMTLAIMAIVFLAIGRFDMFIYSIGLVATLLAFLDSNFTPARIFMGDTGSLFLGFTISYLTLVGVNSTGPEQANFSSSILFAALILPVLDTFRVMAMRMIAGRSPFSPDRTHLHHLLQKIGLNTRQICLVTIVLVSILVTEGIILHQGEKDILYILMWNTLTALFVLNGVVVIRVLRLRSSLKEHGKVMRNARQENLLLGND